MLKVIRRLEAEYTYGVPPSGTHEISVTMLADAARSSEHGQLEFAGSLLIGQPA